MLPLCVDFNRRLLQDELVTSCRPTLATQHTHRSEYLISQATLWGNNAGFHDRRFPAGEGDGRAIFSRPSERFPDSSPFVSVFRLLLLSFASRELHFSEDDVVLCLSETLEDKALKTLMRLGLSTRFPEEYEAWEKRRIEIEKHFQKTLTQRQAEIHVTLEQNSGDIQAKVREAVIDEILKAFP